MANHAGPPPVNRQPQQQVAGESGGRRWPLLLAIFGLFLGQQVPLTLAAVLTPSVYRTLGLPLEQFALFSIPLIPPATRWLWAPVIDRYLDRRIWIACCTTLAFVLYLALAILVPSRQGLPAFIALLTLISTVMATQDIAVDGYVVEALRKGERATGARLRLIASEAGQLIAIAGLMLLYERAGWTLAVTAAAVCLAVFTFPSLLRKPPVRQSVQPGVLRASLARPDTRLLLALVALTAFPAGVAAAIIGPFLVDKGLSIGTIGIALGLASSVAPVLSAITLSPWLTSGRSIESAAGRVLPFTMLAPLGLAGLSLWPSPGAIEVAVAVFIGSFLAAPGLILVYQARLGWTARASAGTEFSLQESVFYLSRNVLTAMVAGPFAALAGWTALFAVNALLAGGALLMFRSLASHMDKLVASRDALKPDAAERA